MESAGIYADGAGGSESVATKPRRAGAGVASVRISGGEVEEENPTPPAIEDIAFSAAEVPGAQTVPRAEATAATFGFKMHRTVPWGMSTASYVVGGAALEGQARGARLQVANENVWWFLYMFLDAPLSVWLSVASGKIKFHQSLAEAMAAGTCLDDWFGNMLGDVAAGWAARKLGPQFFGWWRPNVSSA